MEGDLTMSGNRFGKFFRGGNFKLLPEMEGEREYIQEIGKNVINRIEYFCKYADIFCKFTNMSKESFKNHMVGVRNEIEENIKYCGLKEINRIKMLSDWFIEQEKLLDKHLLHSMEQEYQEMSSMLLRHADKSRAFDTRSPEDFRAFLEDV